MNIPNDMQLDYELIQYRKELKSLQEESEELTKYNEKLQDSFNKIGSGSSYNEHTWLTYDDLSKLSSGAKNGQNKLVVIKAPAGTVMEIPDPKEVDEYFASLKTKPETSPAEMSKKIEDKKYQIHFSSKTDEILVYTVENEEKESSHQFSPEPKQDENIGETLSNMYDK